MKKHNAYTVLSTDDYSLFKLEFNNRELRPNTKLRASMEAYGFLPAYPLHCVRRHGQTIIKDGQHRYHYAKLLGLAVYYIIVEDRDISLPLTQGGQRAWSLLDFITSHAAAGNADYIYLQNFAAAHKLPISACACLLYGHQPSGATNTTPFIQDGTFKVRDVERAEMVAKVAAGLRPYACWTSANLFLNAVYKCICLAEFDADKFLKRVAKMPSLLVRQPTSDLYLQLIERIYNYQAKAPIPLKFLADEAAKARNPANLKLLQPAAAVEGGKP